MRNLLLFTLLTGCSTAELADLDFRTTRGIDPVGRFSFASAAPCAVEARGSIAVVALGAEGLAILDISTPNAPSLVGSLEQIQADDVAVHFDRAAVLARGSFASTGELALVDLLDPRDPLVVLEAPVDNHVGGVAIDGWSVAMAGSVIGWQTGEHAPVTRPEWSGDAPVDGVAFCRGHLCWAGRERSRFGSPGPLRLTTLDPSDDSSKSTLDVPTDARVPEIKMASSGDLLLLATRTELTVLRADQAPPTILARMEIDAIDAIAIDGDVGAITRGGDLYLLDFSNPAHPAVTAHLKTPGNAADVAIDGDTLLIADGVEGLRLYRIVYPVAIE